VFLNIHEFIICSSDKSFVIHPVHIFFYKNKFYKNIRLRFDLLQRISLE